MWGRDEEISFGISIFFCVYWNLSSEIHVCYAGALPLEPLHQPERSLLNSLVEGERDS
jgi:hypothetical protein